MISDLKALAQWTGKRLWAFVFVSWVWAYLWLLDQNRFQAFLQPRFKWLLFMGLAISAIFALVSVSRSATQESGNDTAGSWIRGGFLLLPLFFILNTQGANLGGYALSKRTMGTTVPGLSMEDKIQQSDPSLWTMDIDQLPSTDQPERPIMLTRLLRDWKSYDGKTVLTDGMYYVPEDNPSGYGLVFRFYITCCAADAAPVGVFIKGEGLDQLANDDWVRVRGVFRFEEIDGKTLPSLEVTQVHKIPPPATHEQYLYF